MTQRRSWFFRLTTVMTLVIGSLAAVPARADEDLWASDLSIDESLEIEAINRRPSGPVPSGTRALTSIAAVLMNVVVMPLRFVVGIAGAELGGLTGALTLGDEKAAAGIWNVTTDGSYTATPEAIEGEQPLAWGGNHP